MPRARARARTCMHGVARANINKGPTSNDVSTPDGFSVRTNYRQCYYTSSNNLIRILFLYFSMTRFSLNDERLNETRMLSSNDPTASTKEKQKRKKKNYRNDALIVREIKMDKIKRALSSATIYTWIYRIERR